MSTRLESIRILKFDKIEMAGKFWNAYQINTINTCIQSSVSFDFEKPDMTLPALVVTVISFQGTFHRMSMLAFLRLEIIMVP